MVAHFMVFCKRSNHRCTFEEFPAASEPVRRPVCEVTHGPPHEAGVAPTTTAADCCFSTKESSPVTAGVQAFSSDGPGRQRPHIGQRSGRLVFHQSPPTQMRKRHTRIGPVFARCVKWNGTSAVPGAAGGSTCRCAHVHVGAGYSLDVKKDALLHVSEPRPPTGSGPVS